MTTSSPSCAKQRWARLGQWNLGGQKAEDVDLAAKDCEVVFVQEIAREDHGWNSFDTEHFHWIAHRSPDQWRGVAVGISTDLFDSVIHKIATRRGIWLVVRIRGIGRVILGSLHCHTGVPNAVYQAAVIEFAKACPRKFRHLPLLCGIDANEVPRWNEDEDERAFVESGSSNLNLLVSEMLNIGASACGPRECDRSSPTHFPRDITRAGRHIDMIFSRQANVGSLNIDAERRHVIGSDHALLYGELSTATGRSKHVWGNDSRPRWVVQELPGDFTIVDDDDLQQLAKKYTKPLFSKAYRDNDEIKQAISDAKLDMKPTSWKRVHRLRRAARKQWHDERRTSILNGDWGEYRALQKEKHRCRGWWGSLLAERSALDLTRDVVDHLSSKIVDEKGVNWDDELTSLVQGVTSDGDFVPFTILDVRVELQQMKTRSAVGPGGISVHLLREIASHDTLQYGLLDLINHIVRTQEQPSAWEESFLALLAKCKSPSRPSDLRPICVSSAFHKLISRLVCARCLPLVRRGSRISCCGKGRQSADLVGSISRIRDVTKEWCEPLLLCKLDVAGAFDRIDRRRVAKLLLDRLGGLGCSSELKFLLKQLHTHTLVGNVPGGRTIKLRPNIGIKQGAPESAELFGLVVDSLLTDLVSHPKWTEFGDPFAELGVTLLFYQDDIFLVENDLPKLARRIRAVGRCLQQAGLQLATDKTKIVANEHYKGCRRVRVAQDEFQVAPLGDSLKVLGIPFSLSHDASEQAKVLIGRTREALHAHLDILVAPGPWTHKMKVLQSLVASQFCWIGGAIHWSSADLHALNVLQVHACRKAFGLRRSTGESWYEWNARTSRFIRSWLFHQKVMRWSARALTLQHTLHGHWARHVENVQNENVPGPAFRALSWRSTAWWRQQQQLSPKVSMRHPRRFYASNSERQLAQSHGCLWYDIAKDRSEWTKVREQYLLDWDVPWCTGRQLSIKY